MSGNTATWLIASYSATSFFSLKPASSTSSGGKSLLTPTPFSVKMAFLDAALRLYGVEDGARMFLAIRSLRIAVRLPRQAVVNNTFVKIMRPHKGGVKDATGTGLETPMGNTIAFREYISFTGPMLFAFQGAPVSDLTPLLLNVNYFGKRGGFFQLQDVPVTREWTDETLTANGYTLLTESTTEFVIDGLLHQLDDCSPTMTFEQANIYSGKSIRLAKERLLHHVVLPYRLVSSSKGYSYYERIEYDHQLFPPPEVNQ
jgi:hypothetical protein